MNRKLLFIHITALLISCSSRPSDNNFNVLKYNASNSISSLDPAFASTQDNIWAVSQIFNSLIELDSNLIPQPSIAKDWEIDNYGKKYTFNIKTNIHFQNHSVFKNGIGRKVIASDIAYSLKRIIDPKTASPGAWIFNNKLAENPFEVPNDSTFIINLNKPFSPFISLLSMPYCSVVPHEAVDHYGKSYGRNPVGTGPFQLKQWEDDVKLILKKNPNYHEFIDGKRLPYLDAVAISFIKSKQTAFLEFMQGKLNFFNGIESSFKDEIINKDGTLGKNLIKDYNLIKGSFLNTEYLAILVDDKADNANRFLLNKNFRKALNHSINRVKLIYFLRNEIGEAADGGFIPKGLPSYQKDLDSTYTYDLTKAKQALKESNYDFKSPLVLYTTKDYLDICIFVQNQWKEIGIISTIEVLPSSVLKNEKRHSGLALFRASWIADYADGENYLSCFYSKNFAPNGPNYTHFSNQEFDQLYENSLIESNDSIKRLAYKKMDQIIIKNYPIIPLFYDEFVWLVSKDIQGLAPHPLNLPKLKRVSIRQGK